MNKFRKTLAVGTAAVILGLGGFVTTSANAATNEEITSYLTNAVATQLGITDTTSLEGIIAQALANGLIQPAVTEAAAAAVDGTSVLTPEELSALFDSNLTSQLGAIEQALIDAGITTGPTTPEPEPTDPAVEDDDDYADGYDDSDEPDDMDDDEVDDDSDDDSDELEEEDSDDDESDDTN